MTMENTIDTKLPVSPPLPAPAGSEPWTDAEACEYLRITSRTLRIWRQTRGFPHYRISSKSIRYRKCDLIAWMDRRHKLTTPNTEVSSGAKTP